MQKPSIVFATILALAFSAISAVAQGAYKVESAGAPSGAAAALQSILEAQGSKLTDAQGNVVAEIWLRKAVPMSTAAAGSGDVIYGGLGVGELVAVLNFPTGFSDFRGQKIKPGYYTARYAQIPQDGNHMGVSNYRDFLLMTPLASDPQPAQAVTLDALLKMSRLASGSNHPAILMLDPASASAAANSAFADDQGNTALQVKLNGSSGAGTPFAIVLVGQYQG